VALKNWMVDVLGPQDASGDYHLEIAIGLLGGQKYPAVVQEFSSRDDQVNSYKCALGLGTNCPL
jgi:hypothetical protein